ncbi:nucleotidyltransferase domain-containing protein [Desulfonema magnum]|uniref:Polymerase nucleotidyl transferase domain-containing protein n=1 Tax=Desulfonema magnum TaxID=45655 RepID=A0A975BIT0_9BACT|nr:nucleotidyltransferase domain-containing protein [Desulfonema magnum]QTA86302.1 Polymerase nucleotidyl transferase domain-containing protein [Desulfonema magnum]
MYFHGKKLLPKIKSVITSDYPSSEIILYGSRSRGQEDAFSDWDILVVTEENLTQNEKIEIHNKIFEIELETGEIISAVIHTRDEWNRPLMQLTPFYQNVINEGIPI